MVYVDICAEVSRTGRIAECLLSRAEYIQQLGSMKASKKKRTCSCWTYAREGSTHRGISLVLSISMWVTLKEGWRRSHPICLWSLSAQPATGLGLVQAY